jgi:DNA-binding NarL/FixJ family response regulator
MRNWQLNIDNKVVELMGTDRFVLGSDFDKQDESRISFNITIDKVCGANIFLIEDVNRKPDKEHSNSNQQEILRLKNLGYKVKDIIEELKISRKTYDKWKG